jgi:hypothetical protein
MDPRLEISRLVNVLVYKRFWANEQSVGYCLFGNKNYPGMG